MKVVLLGTGGGGGLIRPNRHQSATSVQIEDTTLLFDCGEGATRQLQKAGISPLSVTHLFFTHHHYDHNTDYPLFVLSSWHLGRHEPLQVIGPEGTAQMSALLFGEGGVFHQDIGARTGLSGSQRLMEMRAGKRLEPVEICVSEVRHSGSVMTAGAWKVSACFTEHVEPYMKSLAYRVDCEGRSMVLAGDSAPTQAVIELAKGADLLIHECSGTDDFIESMGLAHHHSGPAGAAWIASEAGVSKLVVNHILRDADQPAILQEIRETLQRSFPGEVYIGEDLMSIEV